MNECLHKIKAAAFLLFSLQWVCGLHCCNPGSRRFS